MAGRVLQNKIAVVTGSTSGIGLGIASVLARAGANIVLNGFGDAKEIEKLQLTLSRESSVRVIYHPADMSKPSEILDLVKKTESEFGRLDIMVNNAGIQFTSPIEDFPEEKWESILQINLSSAFYTSKYALPLMRKNQFGRIVNVASVHGLVASANKSAYVAAKHGLLGLTKVTALENARTPITCNAICPGWVLTPLVEKQIQAKAKEGNITFEQATQALLAEKQPSLRFTTPEDIGEAVKFLCSPAAANLTGVSIPVDGGWTAQ